MRVSVVGSSGSGKSTLARSVAAHLGLPYLELDSVYHQPGWTPLPDEQFAERVSAFAAGAEWVIDGNYGVARPLVWARADVIVWLDLPRRLVMRRLISRTVRRGVRRRELWNGNRESLLTLFRGGRENLLFWSWTRHASYRERYAAAMTDPAYAQARFIRIQRPSDAAVDRVLALISAGAGE